METLMFYVLFGVFMTSAVVMIVVLIWLLVTDR